MPYESSADLPPSVRRRLPPHAREIFRAAFNAAWRRHPGAEQEETARRIAWAAVKRGDHKSDDLWVPRR